MPENPEKEKQVRKQLLNNKLFFKILFITSAFIFIKADVYAVNETQIPVSTSFSETIQSVQNTQNLGQQGIKATSSTQTNNAQTQQQQENTTTLAHEAVTGTIEQKTQDELNNPNSNQDLSVLKKEIQKQTKPKKSYVNVIFKFLLALIWVAISSIIIFIILLSYKKLILKGKPITPTYESTEQSLDTPKNFKEAIKLFLDKTKWD